MTLAAAFNRSLNRSSNRQPLNDSEGTNLNNRLYLNDGKSFDTSNGSVPLSGSVERSPGLQPAANFDVAPQTPVSATSELYPSSDVSNAVLGHQRDLLSSEPPFLSPTHTPGSPAAKNQSRNVSVPTSFLRHRSDSRVSYIDSNVAPSPFYSPTQSNNSSARNSTIEARESSLEYSDNNKRKSFSVLSGQNAAAHHSKKLDRLLEIPQNTPQELVPILTLFNSQQARVYKEGYFQLVIEKNVSSYGRNLVLPNSDALSCYGSLSGNELAIWDINERNFKPIYINVSDASFTNYFDQATIKIINPSSNHYYLKFETAEHHKAWFTALLLSYFEFNSLHEAYTGALLSAKAIHLNDIKTLLAETRYSFGEWCNIKLNYISSKWLRVYAVVVPRQKDKPGYVNIYSSDKTSNKKNLILTINQGFGCFSVYPLVPETIDNSSLIKVEGEMTIHNWKFLLSKGVSNNTAMIPPSPVFANHNNSSDGNSRTSNRSRSSSLGSMKLGKRKSTASLASSNSGSFSNTPGAGNSDSALPNNTVNANHFVSSLYIMPEPHPGVANFEIMIRLLIPLFDAFELYGRPKRLKSDKTNFNSLLFALPVLPKSKYLDYEEAFRLVNAKISGLPIERERPATAKKTITTSTSTSKKLSKSKGLLSKFKKNKDMKDDEPSVTTASSAPHTFVEFKTAAPIERWTNREWLFFLKYELKNKLDFGYDGAGHLIEDFEAIT